MKKDKKKPDSIAIKIQKDYILQNRIIRDLGQSMFLASQNGLKNKMAYEALLKKINRERVQTHRRIRDLLKVIEEANSSPDADEKAIKLVKIMTLATELSAWYAKTPEQRRADKKRFTVSIDMANDVASVVGGWVKAEGEWSAKVEPVKDDKKDEPK